MNKDVLYKLDFTKGRFLVTIKLMGALIILILGNATSIPAQSRVNDMQEDHFTLEAVSIKPDESDFSGFRMMYTSNGFTVKATPEMIIRIAYGVQDFQISGAPKWLNSERYEIEAKMNKATIEQINKLDKAQATRAHQQMLRELLANQYKLVLHHETKELPIYSLVIAKSGPKLQQAKPEDTYLSGIKDPNGQPMKGAHLMRIGPGELTGQALPIAELVRLLSQQLGRTILDKTGLKGEYDFALKWTPEGHSSPLYKGNKGGTLENHTLTPDSSEPTLFAALQQQLGLRLESQRGPVDIFIIDRVEKPSVKLSLARDLEYRPRL
jgi:uncharacterized protein (TIGR03435 family)